MEMKQLVRSAGYFFLGLGITLTLFDFFLEHSEWVVGAGFILLILSFLFKKY
tara:strand:+ start:503 stop:658 length:156 start_codon:yes stop_codon:yes gene_type:complete